MSHETHWTEEAIIDFVLGKLSVSEKAGWERHLTHCEECHAKYRYWQSILLEGQTKPQPSDHLKLRLLSNIKPKTKPKRTAFVFKWAVVGFAVLMLTVIGVNLNPFTIDPFNEQYATEQQVPADTVKFVRDPHTIQYDVKPAMHDHRMDGNVWVNRSTGEILLKVDGLVPIIDKDYQVWLIHNDHRFNSRLLDLQGGRALLYLQDRNLERVERIRASIEPRGGSRLPTGPDSFFVELKHEYE